MPIIPVLHRKEEKQGWENYPEAWDPASWNTQQDKKTVRETSPQDQGERRELTPKEVV